MEVKTRKRVKNEQPGSKNSKEENVFRVVNEDTRKDEKMRSAKEDVKRQNSTTSVSKLDFKGNLIFWIIVAVSQVVGLACVGLVIRFAILYGGFSWIDANLQFNYHPVLMVSGLIFLYGDAIIAYRVFSVLPKTVLKIVHALVHGGAILCSAVGLVAVFENHRRTNKGDFWSLHSWLGLATFIMFSLQYTSGFITYLFPGIPLSMRTAIMPYHRFFGLGIFLMAIASAHMGLTQKLLWTSGYTTGKNVSEGNVGNALGLLLVVFGFLIVYLATKHSYKRKPLPDELPSSSRQHQQTTSLN